MAADGLSNKPTFYLEEEPICDSALPPTSKDDNTCVKKGFGAVGAKSSTSRHRKLPALTPPKFDALIKSEIGHSNSENVFNSSTSLVSNESQQSELLNSLSSSCISGTVPQQDAMGNFFSRILSSTSLSHSVVRDSNTGNPPALVYWDLINELLSLRHWQRLEELAALLRSLTEILLSESAWLSLDFDAMSELVSVFALLVLDEKKTNFNVVSELESPTKSSKTASKKKQALLKESVNEQESLQKSDSTYASPPTAASIIDTDPKISGEHLSTDVAPTSLDTAPLPTDKGPSNIVGTSNNVKDTTDSAAGVNTALPSTSVEPTVTQDQAQSCSEVPGKKGVSFADPQCCYIEEPATPVEDTGLDADPELQELSEEEQWKNNVIAQLLIVYDLFQKVHHARIFGKHCPLNLAHSLGRMKDEQVLWTPHGAEEFEAVSTEPENGGLSSSPGQTSALPTKFPFPFINLQCMRSLQSLDINRVPWQKIRGLSSHRSRRLRYLMLRRSGLPSVRQLAVHCCGDQAEERPWNHLLEVDMSYNPVRSVDTSVALFVNITALHLTHCSLTSAEGLQHLSAKLAFLDLSYNNLSAVPVLSESCRRSLLTLRLVCNFIVSLRGLAQLEALQHLELQDNLIMMSGSLPPLGCLSGLKSLRLTGNPVCYQPNFRYVIISRLHPNVADNKFALDEKRLSKEEASRVATNNWVFVRREACVYAAPGEEPLMTPEAVLRAQQAALPPSDSRLLPVLKPLDDTAPVKPKRKRSAKRTRLVEIAEPEGDEPVPATTDASSAPAPSDTCDGQRSTAEVLDGTQRPRGESLPPGITLRESEGVLPRQMALEELLLSAVLTQWAQAAEEAAAAQPTGASGSQPQRADAEQKPNGTSCAGHEQNKAGPSCDVDGRGSENAADNAIDGEKVEIESHVQANGEIKPEDTSGEVDRQSKTSDRAAASDESLANVKRKNEDDKEDEETDLNACGTDEKVYQNGKFDDDYDDKDGGGAAGGSLGSGSSSNSAESYRDAGSGGSNGDSDGGERSQEQERSGSGGGKSSDLNDSYLMNNATDGHVNNEHSCGGDVLCKRSGADENLACGSDVQISDEDIAAAAITLASAVAAAAASAVITAAAVVAGTTTVSEYFSKNDTQTSCSNSLLHALCGADSQTCGTSLDVVQFSSGVQETWEGLQDCGSLSSFAATHHASSCGERQCSTEAPNLLEEHVACRDKHGSEMITNSTPSTVSSNEKFNTLTDSLTTDWKSTMSLGLTFDSNNPELLKAWKQRRNSLIDYPTNELSVSRKCLFCPSGLPCKFSHSTPDLSLSDVDTCPKLERQYMWCPVLRKYAAVLTGSRVPGVRYPIKVRTASYEGRVIEYWPPRFVETGSESEPQLERSVGRATSAKDAVGRAANRPEIDGVQDGTARGRGAAWCLRSCEVTITISGYVLTEMSAASNTTWTLLLDSVRSVAAMGAGRIRFIYGDKPADLCDRTYELRPHARKALLKHLKSLLPAAKLHLKVQNVVTCGHCRRSFSSCLAVRIPGCASWLCPDCGWSLEGEQADLTAVNEILRQRHKQKNIIAGFGYHSHCSNLAAMKFVRANRSASNDGNCPDNPSKDGSSSNDPPKNISASGDSPKNGSTSDDPPKNGSASDDPPKGGSAPEDPSKSSSSDDLSKAKNPADGPLDRSSSRHNSEQSSTLFAAKSACCPSHDDSIFDVNPGITLLARLLSDPELSRIPYSAINTAVAIVSGAPPCPYAVKAGDFRPGVSERGILLRPRPYQVSSQCHNPNSPKTSEEQVVDLVRSKLAAYAKQRANQGSNASLEAMGLSARTKECSRRSNATRRTGRRESTKSRSASRTSLTQPSSSSHAQFPSSQATSSDKISAEDRHVAAALAAFKTPREFYLSYKPEGQAQTTAFPISEPRSLNPSRGNFLSKRDCEWGAQTMGARESMCGLPYDVASPGPASLAGIGGLPGASSKSAYRAKCHGRDPGVTAAARLRLSSPELHSPRHSTETFALGLRSRSLNSLTGQPHGQAVWLHWSSPRPRRVAGSEGMPMQVGADDSWEESHVSFCCNHSDPSTVVNTCDHVGDCVPMQEHVDARAANLDQLEQDEDLSCWRDAATDYDYSQRTSDYVASNDEAHEKNPEFETDVDSLMPTHTRGSCGRSAAPLTESDSRRQVVVDDSLRNEPCADAAEQRLPDIKYEIDANIGNIATKYDENQLVFDIGRHANLHYDERASESLGLKDHSYRKCLRTSACDYDGEELEVSGYPEVKTCSGVDPRSVKTETVFKPSLQCLQRLKPDEPHGYSEEDTEKSFTSCSESEDSCISNCNLLDMKEAMPISGTNKSSFREASDTDTAHHNKAYGKGTDDLKSSRRRRAEQEEDDSSDGDACSQGLPSNPSVSSFEVLRDEMPEIAEEDY